MASDDETVPNYLSGEDDDIPTDEDSAGSLVEFIVDSDDESEESASGSESGGDSENESDAAQDVEVDGEKPEWIDERNIIAGGRTRRKRKAPERYQDDNYAKLMISDSEVSLSSSEEESESDDDDFRYDSDDSGTGTNDSDSGGEVKRSRVE